MGNSKGSKGLPPTRDWLLNLSSGLDLENFHGIVFFFFLTPLLEDNCFTMF